MSRAKAILSAVFTVVAAVFFIAVFATLGLAVIGAGAAGALFALIYGALKSGPAAQADTAADESVIYGQAPAEPV